MAAAKIVLKHLQKCEGMDNFEIECEEDDILRWTVKFSPRTIRYNDVYTFTVNFPSTYPFKAPEVKFVSDLLHPNIDESGKICITILNEWSPSFSANLLFQHIYSIFLEPNLENPVNLKAVDWWNQK